MKRGKVTALVMAFIMAVSVLASPVTMLNTNAAVKAKKITMAKKATLEVGAKKKLKVTVKPAKAKVKITFRTSNSRIAKVNSKGVVKGVKAGQATITAKAKVGKKVLKAKQKITVKKKAKQTPAAIKITSLTVKKYDVTINEGNIETMAVTVLPANATNKKLQYTTSDNNVARVDNKGVITAIAQGSCKVTAETMDGSNRSISVNVTVTKTQRPRCIITQDAEVDDMNSLIHVLLYSNEVDIQGIVQSSSKFHWKGVAGQKEEKYTKPYRWPGTEWMQKYLNAYQKVYPNLKKHDKSYPAPAYLKSVTKVGNIGYKGEMDSVTEGSELIKKKILDNDERTLYLLAWGGTNTISRALKDIEKEYKGTKQWDAIRKKIINKVVIPACGEQDETYSEYIAEEWPEIKFMSCSQMSSYAYMWRTQPEDSSKKTLYADFMLKNLIRKHGALLDNYVTWGDGTYLDGEEPGSQFGTNEDLLDSLNWWGGFNPVQKYQRYDFLSEGDSPTFFMLLDTGLRTLEDITNGGFSGRYAKADKKNSKGRELNYWSPVKDTYVKEDRSTMQVESSWKYIDDIQNDFAARADWCITNDYAKANHAPKVSVTEGTDIKASAGETLKLHAIATDSDDDYVTVSWSEYTDASTTETALTLKGAASDTISFKIPEGAKAGQKIHLIVQAQDDGEHTLTHYQQVIITIK